VNDGQPIFGGAGARKTTTATWSRRLDEASTGSVVIPVSGTDLSACCEGVNKIEPLRTELIIERNRIPVWQGWVMNDVEIDRDNIRVNAHDILEWTTRRVLDQNHVHTQIDLTQIALDYIADVNAEEDLPFVITSAATGILADRTVLQTEYRYGWDALRDLLESGLDATVVAGHLLLGQETQICGTLQLRDTDIDGSPTIKLNGAERATRVIVKGGTPPDEGSGSQVIAVWPPAPPDVCYHAADYIIEDDSILDMGSALATAQAAYDRLSSSFPYYLDIPEGSGLRPQAPVHINALIPGAIVQFYSQRLCVDIGMAMRLVAVDVEAASGSEQVRVAFEPLGDGEVLADAAA
jgi:hypothetical protein